MALTKAAQMGKVAAREDDFMLVKTGIAVGQAIGNHFHG